jgi:2-polyprenyl-3-methyl-5-hydroxy-6-metoxy-1,4-benzoquinol methylase
VTSPLARARRGAQVLYRLGARRVWICGSIARAGRWDERSDVDYAVEGLPAHRLAEAHGALARLTARRVHVVPLEQAAAGLRAAVLTGRILVDPDGRVHAAPAAPAATPARPAGAVTAPGPWHERRLAAVASALTDAGARRIVDFGCGTGRLIEALARAGVDRLTGVDRDAETLAMARARLDRTLPDAARRRIAWRHGPVSVWDDALAGHDAAAAVELIEHLDPPDLDGFVTVVFARLRPSTVVLTTPNREYNALLKAVDLRHPEHRFEWTRAQFRAWSAQIAAAHGYAVRLRPLGRTVPGYGPVTQLAVFTARDSAT